MRARIALLAFLLAVLAVLLVPRGASAEAPLSMGLILVPVGAAPAIELSGYKLVAELSCQGEHCSLQVEQVYYLHNGDRAHTQTLQVGLLRGQGGGEGAFPQVELFDGQGQPLASVGVSSLHRLVWETSLRPDGREQLVLRFSLPLASSFFLVWDWDTSPLASWSRVDSARLEWRFPSHLTDQAFLEVSPSDFSFDGWTLFWAYEGAPSPARHRLLMYLPPVWQKLQDLRIAQAHWETAQLLLALWREAQALGVPMADPFPQVLAELELLLERHPDDAQARLLLAELYQQRAQKYPELRLNYLLLAAQAIAPLVEGRASADPQLIELLRRLYYSAAQEANELDDPAGALLYLERARRLPGEANQSSEALEQLALRWALLLARKGQGTQALLQVGEMLSPRVRDELLHYAPPFTSVETRVSLWPGRREVTYTLTLYLPAAESTWERLQELAARLEGLGCQARVERPAEERALCWVEVPYRSAEELEQKRALLLRALEEDEDLVSAFLAAPWRWQAFLYGLKPTLWYDRYLYREVVDLAPLEGVWTQEAQYARWRLVELRTAQPVDERARLEQELARIVLQEQNQLWNHLPVSSRWLFEVHYGAGAPKGVWVLGWGQRRELTLNQVRYRWWLIERVGGFAGGMVFLGVLLALLKGKKRSRGLTQS